MVRGDRPLSLAEYLLAPPSNPNFTPTNRTSLLSRYGGPGLATSAALRGSTKRSSLLNNDTDGQQAKADNGTSCDGEGSTSTHDGKKHKRLTPEQQERIDGYNKSADSNLATLAANNISWQPEDARNAAVCTFDSD